MSYAGIFRVLLIGLVISMVLIGIRHARDNYIPPSISFVNQGNNGERIMKIVLITKNEAPLIRSWVLYHGDIFGFNNLHILDSSDDPEVLDFLRTARDRLGVDVTFFSADLHVIEHQFNIKMKSIRDQCDFIIKLDTDELLTLYDPDARSFSVDRRHLFDYLRSLPFDGDMYKAGFSSSSSIERGKCMDDDNVFMSSINFTPFTETSRKTFLNSKTFKSLDLGGHDGKMHPALEKSRPKHEMYHSTRLAYFHFHAQCYHRTVKNNLRAIVSHRYLNGKESKSLAISKLEKIVGKEFPARCLVHSCHKIRDYLAYLKDRDLSEIQYYQEYGPTDNNIEITTLRETIEHVEEKYKEMLK